MPRVQTAKTQPPLVTINTSPQEPPQPAQTAKVEEERSPSWFWDLLNSFQKDEWGRMYDVWLIRLGDTRVPMASGEKGYLDMFVEPISPSMIKAKYGGGKYRAILRKNSQFKTSHDFDIEGAAVYSAREVPGARVPTGNGNGPGNDAALIQQFIGVLRDELARSREANNGSGAGENKTIEMMASGAERAMDLITKQVPQATNPAGQLESLANVIKNLGLGGAPGGGILDTIRALKELGLIGASAPNPMEQLTMFLGLFEKMDALRGGGEGGGRPRDWKAIAAEKLAEAVPSVLDALRTGNENSVRVAEENRRRAEAQRSTAEIVRHIPQAVHAPSASAQPPQSAPRGAAPAIPASAAPLSDSGLRTVRLNDEYHPDAGAVDVPPVTSHQSPVTEIDVTSEAYMRLVKRQIVYLVEKGQTGESIVDYLDGAVPGYSEKLTQGTPEQVTMMMTLDPILVQVAQHPDWLEILQEARAYILDERKAVAAGRVQ